MSSLYDNFKQYAQFGTAPTVKQDDNGQVPQNCSYKSVDHINSVMWPVENVLFGIKSNFLECTKLNLR